MNTAAIATSDQGALKLALQYWAAHWDWECPLLFGIRLEQLQEVISHWPQVPAHLEEAAALASLSSLRELLYGASAVSKQKVPELIGLSYEQAHALCSQVHALVRPVGVHNVT